MDECKSCREIARLRKRNYNLQKQPEILGHDITPLEETAYSVFIKHLKDFHPCTCKEEKK